MSSWRFIDRDPWPDIGETIIYIEDKRNTQSGFLQATLNNMIAKGYTPPTLNAFGKNISIYQNTVEPLLRGRVGKVIEHVNDDDAKYFDIEGTHPDYIRLWMPLPEIPMELVGKYALEYLDEPVEVIA